ncbi:hypothetical protein [Yinghuangia seranimata]|uniref:hypothetical protein n=1 Tax=Yinghuangia seranimata TaxID=408067 RepID=UPI00248CC1B5|nr:hypothetical protein [Yinghuangia seranimata]MDI2131294.1 hypothetical protein [Yinghuangia seranimata]
MPAAFGDPLLWWRQVLDDERIPSTTITSPTGTPNVLRKAMAAPALRAAAEADSLQAALDALHAAAHGSGFRTLLVDVRQAWPALGDPPLPPEGPVQPGVAYDQAVNLAWMESS